MNPLSKKQKADICIIARRAWKAGAGEGWRGDLNADCSESALFRGWRRQQQHECCGLRSLTTCLQDADFPLLMAHFAALIPGNDAQAGYWLERLVEDSRNRVLFILKRSCAQYSLAWPSYPAAICRRQYKCGLGAASEKQLWALVYTCRNRGREKRKKVVGSGLRVSDSNPTTNNLPTNNLPTSNLPTNNLPTTSNLPTHNPAPEVLPA